MSVSRGTADTLAAYAALVRDEAQRQNLVAASTLPDFEQRHIEDSAQLLVYGRPGGTWLDIGSGAGLPGIVLAILGCTICLVESRKLRAAFLDRCIQELGLVGRATLHSGRVEAMPATSFNVITARAYAPLPKLLASAWRFSTKDTIWVLPKGRSANSELEAVRGTWQGDFRVERSTTDADAAIIIASNLRPKEQR